MSVSDSDYGRAYLNSIAVRDLEAHRLFHLSPNCSQSVNALLLIYLNPFPVSAWQGQQEDDKDVRSEILYPYGFPLSLVKRIVNMDEDVRSISSDALKATSKAAELVLQALAAKAFKVLHHLRLHWHLQK